MNMPEPRAMPAGHHELRRAHLIDEIRRSRQPLRLSRRVLTGGGFLMVAGTGVAAAASAGVLGGSSNHPSITVACYQRAATQHVKVTVIHPEDIDPVTACQMLWRHRMIMPAPRNRPPKAANGQIPAPDLVACVLPAQNGRPAPVGVFPGPPETCQSLGLRAQPFTH